jgi:hypothetical protein
MPTLRHSITEIGWLYGAMAAAPSLGAGAPQLTLAASKT